MKYSDLNKHEKLLFDRIDDIFTDEKDLSPYSFIKICGLLIKKFKMVGER